MMLNQRTVLKLRAGHTVWRCLIWFKHDRLEAPYVDIEEVHLVGVQKRFSPEYKTPQRGLRQYRQEGYKHYRFMSDIAHTESFTTRRGALRFRKEVLNGQHEKRVADRYETLKGMDRGKGTRHAVFDTSKDTRY
jgi:hypothetical protein